MFRESIKEAGMGRIKRFWQDESGGIAVEYSLILTLIALSVVGGVSLWGKAVKDTLEKAAARLPGG